MTQNNMTDASNLNLDLQKDKNMKRKTFLPNYVDWWE